LAANIGVETRVGAGMGTKLHSEEHMTLMDHERGRDRDMQAEHVAQGATPDIDQGQRNVRADARSIAAHLRAHLLARLGVPWLDHAQE
jgi:hypothetical protein